MQDETGILIKPTDVPADAKEQDLRKIESLIEADLEKKYGKGIWNTLESLQLIEEALKKIRIQKDQKIMKELNKQGISFIKPR